MNQITSESGARPTLELETERSLAFDYLRSFGVLLVVLHHAALAYVTFGFLNPEAPMQTFSPIVDGAKWAGFDRIALVNDTFFMPLLFLVSGLFAWTSLQKKGTLNFFLGRLKRLGIPFVFGLLVLTPLAFYPTVLEIELVFGDGQSLGAFWLDFFRAGFGTAGPLWFISLLLAFDIIVSVSYAVLGKLETRQSNLSNCFLVNPIGFVLALFGLSVAAYVPMSNAFGPSAWMGIGPFQVQISRVFLYLLYFLAGVALGAHGLEQSALRRDGPIAKHWWAWLLAGAASYTAQTWMFAISPQSPLIRYLFLAEMALMVMALVALFVKFAGRGNRVLNSLSRNSYGIYLLHYLVIIWLQYAVLRLKIGAGWKFAVVFFGGVAICWGVIATLQRIQPVARVI